MHALKHWLRVCLAIYCVTRASTKILRNNALMSKMVSNFQKDNHEASEDQRQTEEHTRAPERVLSLMQNVLCKNFPTIPCNLIVADETLRKLIEKSIQQIHYKKLPKQTTAAPEYHVTMFPVVNSEDLSSFLQVNDKGYFEEKQEKRSSEVEKVAKKRKHKNKAAKHFWSHEYTKANKKKSKNTHDKQRSTNTFSNRKKLRKFYPHKIKYKDKNSDKHDRTYMENSEEKSVSIEVPDTGRKSYRGETGDPVWRIDYLKHGEPSLNMVNYQGDLKGKIIKSGPNVLVDDKIIEQSARKDVLHPDVYIKKSVRKKSVDINNSEVFD